MEQDSYQLHLISQPREFFRYPPFANRLRYPMPLIPLYTHTQSFSRVGYESPPTVQCSVIYTNVSETLLVNLFFLQKQQSSSLTPQKKIAIYQYPFQVCSVFYIHSSGYLFLNFNNVHAHQTCYISLFSIVRKSLFFFFLILSPLSQFGV